MPPPSARLLRRSLTTLAAVLALAAIGTLVWRTPLRRFLRINRANYYNNLSRWEDALRLLDGLPPKAFQDRRRATLEMDAQLQLGRPYEAIQTWEDYLARAGIDPGGDYEILYGLALVLGARRSQAESYLARGEDAYSRALAELLATPTFQAYRTANELFRQRFEKRWLYVGIVNSLGARLMTQTGEVGQAAGDLRYLVGRFTGQAYFCYEYAFTNIRRQEMGLGIAYALAARELALARFGPGPAADALHVWREELAEECLRLIYAGRSKDALELMRHLSEPMDLPIEKSLQALWASPRSTRATVVELDFFGGELARRAVGLEPPEDLLGPDRPWLNWLEGYLSRGEGGADLPRPRPVLRARPLLEAGPITLEAGAPVWSVRLTPPEPNVGGRLLLLKLQGEGAHGIGPAYQLSDGWKVDKGYVGPDSAWHAFDLALTVGDPLAARLDFSREPIFGYDIPPETAQTRRIHLQRAELIEFRR